MPTIPLYTPCPVELADGSHQVRAPGGYEWWYFDAEDRERGLHIVAIFFDGFVFHSEYLRRYYDYLRQPTRRRPPVPGEYPCVYFAVYRDGRPAAQFMSQYPPREAEEKPRLRGCTFGQTLGGRSLHIGPNSVRWNVGGHMGLHVEGTPWRLTWRGPRLLAGSLSADVDFRPRWAGPPHERTFLTRRLAGADHRWVLVNPRCDVQATIRLPSGESLEFAGSGYHDHNYGTGPLTQGLRCWMWGRVLEANRALVFHHAWPKSAELPAESQILIADAAGVRPVPDATLSLEDMGRTALLLGYPRHIRIPGLLSARCRQIIDNTPFYLRLLYDVEDPAGSASALCEIAYPNRLRWPILGRLIEMSINRIDQA